MIPELIWAPDFFDPQEIWALRNLGPDKFGPQEACSLHKNSIHWFSCRDQTSWGPNLSGPKFLGDQIFRGPNFLGTEKARGPNMIGYHLSYCRLKYCSVNITDFCVPYFLTYIHSYSFWNLEIVVNQNSCFNISIYIWER